MLTRLENGEELRAMEEVRCLGVCFEGVRAAHGCTCTRTENCQPPTPFLKSTQIVYALYE
jgi:hypothetical protein